MITRPLPLAAALTALTLPASTLAATVAFQNPASATWGNWTRSTAGAIYVHYDVFGNPPGLGTTPVLPDQTPDKGKFGTSGTQGATLLTRKKGSTASPAAFITGSANIYSFSDVLDFDLIVQAGSAHTALGSQSITVALQLAVLGADIDHASVKLLGQSWASRTLLASGSSSQPGGSGTGVDNEYLYLWNLTAALPVYTFDFAAIGTSLSLEAVAVDIGPAPNLPPVVPPPISAVPLPAAGLLLGGTLLAAPLLRRRARSLSNDS